MESRDQQQSSHHQSENRVESALVSMILGIASLPFICCAPVGVILALIAIICGHLAMKELKQDSQGKSGWGQALTGLITGYLALIFILISFVGMAFEKKSSKTIVVPYENREDAQRTNPPVAPAEEPTLGIEIPE